MEKFKNIIYAIIMAIVSLPLLILHPIKLLHDWYVDFTDKVVDFLDEIGL